MDADGVGDVAARSGRRRRYVFLPVTAWNLLGNCSVFRLPHLGQGGLARRWCCWKVMARSKALRHFLQRYS